MNLIHSWTDRLTRRFAEGEFDGYVGVAVFGLAMGALFAISILMESQ